MTVTLDRDLSRDAGACTVESLRTGYRFDVATGLFVSLLEFVRAGAPGPPDTTPRSGERQLETVNGEGVSLFLADQHPPHVVGDEASLAIQRGFRTQRLNVLCSDGLRPFAPQDVSATVRFPPRSREVIARFPRSVGSPQKILCGVETDTTGTEAFGSLGAVLDPSGG